MNKINENYNVESVDYKIKAVWPLQTGFSWKVDEELELNKLPLRLCHINDKNNNNKIKIKTRIDCAKDVKKYAILSYFWGGKPKEDIKWNTESAVDRLSLGGKKSLKKVIETIEILKETHDLEVKHFWMDQLCMNQESTKRGLRFNPNKGIKITGLEYVISAIEKSGGIYKSEREETVDGGLWRKKAWVKTSDEKKAVKLTLSGTQEGIKAVDKGRVIIIPSKDEWEWEGDRQFAILASKIGEINRHRIDLLRIEEGYENLIEKDENGKERPKSEEKTFIIGLNNQEDTTQYQAQIEIPPKK